MQRRENRETDRRGFSFTEILIAMVILAVAAIPLFNVLSMGMRGVERSRDHIIAYAVAEKIQEEIDHMLHDETRRQEAIDFQTSGSQPLTSIPFFPELAKAVQSAIAAAPQAKRGDAAKALQDLKKFQVQVVSANEVPKGAPQAIWLAKDIDVIWKDNRGKDKSVHLSASFANTDIYHQVVKENYRNAKSVTDKIFQDIMSRRNQPLVKYDSDKLAQEMTYPLKSNEFIDPDPWYEGYLASVGGLTINRRLGTAGATSDERMAVKEAALAQFFGMSADEARVLTYDNKDQAEEVVKKLENLPPYSEAFKNVQGVDGVGVRAPGTPGAYSCLNCHAPQFLATIDDGYFSIPRSYLDYEANGKTGKEWLLEYLDILKQNDGLSQQEYDKFAGRLDSPDAGIFSGATSPAR